MSKPLSMGDLTVKFHSNRAGVYRGETTIGQAPEGSLYRVVRRLDPAEFEIATLVPTGWITLLQRLGGRAQDRSMTASADSGLPLDDVLDLSAALDLVDAKIELLSEYKLKYPQDYTPDGIRSMNDEGEQWTCRPTGKQSPPPEKTTMP